MRDRAVFGAGGYIGVGQTDGRAYGSRHGPVHSHSVSVNDPGHSHNIDAFGNNNEWGYASLMGSTHTADHTKTGGAQHKGTGITATVGPGGTIQDAVTYAAVLVIITTGQ